MTAGDETHAREPRHRVGVGFRVRKNGSVTEATTLHDICDDEAVDAERSNRHGSYPRAGLAILALALGGFAIGTTEFVTMGLLPQIARGLGISIPSAGHAVSAYAPVSYTHLTLPTKA